MFRTAASSLILVLSGLLPPPGSIRAADGANMNGSPGQYRIANPNPNSESAFSTDYAAETEYFDMYSDTIKTRYSEVHWKMHSGIPLPKDIVARFEGKVMAVVGYEVDQVREEDGSSVPITWAYNHHYGAWLLNGEKARLVKKEAADESVRNGYNHGSAEHWTVEPISDGNGKIDDGPFADIPKSHFFSEGNGGEFRLSYHGYPRGYAQLIYSPDTFNVIPMQIDTWNREDMDVGTTGFVPGPLPKSSRIPGSAGYSGLIECPCSDRLEKKYGMTYAALDPTSSCDDGDVVSNSTECFSGADLAVPSVLSTVRREVKDDDAKPEGCSVEMRLDGSKDVWWNSKSSSSAAVGDQGRSGGEEEEEEEEREATAATYSAFGSAQVNVTVSLTATDADDAASITIVGPADVWLGVGFGSSSMCLKMEADECPSGGPYAIVVTGDGEDGAEERRLDFHGPGDVLSRGATVKSNVVVGGTRTVVLTRPLKGPTDRHYSFEAKAGVDVPIITARGCDLTFARHCGHGPSSLAFLEAGRVAPVCRAGVEGTIGGSRFDNQRCAQFPTGDLAAQGNPTCSVEKYRGGLSCCRNGQSLLDLDQDVPWPDRFLEYRLKFRFYFEEYKAGSGGGGGGEGGAVGAPPSHRNLVRLYWQTEAFSGEYDIIQCPEGTPPSQCVQVITSRWTVREMVADKSAEGIELIYAGPHCHAPTCISMDLYDADTGRLLCHMEPIHGSSDDLYDEHEFLSIPPCLWGDESEGLVEPVFLSQDTTLMSIKRNNSTLGHTGEMASWQMRGIVVRKGEAPPVEEGGGGGGSSSSSSSSIPAPPALAVGVDDVAAPVERLGKLRRSGS